MNPSPHRSMIPVRPLLPALALLMLLSACRSERAEPEVVVDTAAMIWDAIERRIG